ncbi:MAG: transcription termination/antitermination protein NusG [Candidatus Omnitrophota bacterium]
MSDLEVDKSSWFIVSTKPKQEFIAEQALKSLGANVYLPLYYKKVKKDKEKIQVLSPLFSGYLFAQFSIVDTYHKVRYTRGVKAVLGNNDCLWTINNERIEDIRSREDNGIVMMKRKDDDFKSGDRILIDEGDFDGWEGVFYEELPDNERAIIMLTSVSYTSKLIVLKKYLRHK